MKKAILHVNGQDIKIAYKENNGQSFVLYEKDWIKDFFAKDAFNEEEILSSLEKENNFLSRRQIFRFFKKWYSDRYVEKTFWLRKIPESDLLKILPNVQNDTRIRLVNGLLVREHPTVHGLYSLNDAWKGSKRYINSEKVWNEKNPVSWQKNAKKDIIDLCQELENLKNLPEQKQENLLGVDSFIYHPAQQIEDVSYISRIKTGPVSYRGTYVHLRLINAYAEYLHPRFKTSVLKTFEEHEENLLRRTITEEREDSKQSFIEFKRDTKRVGGNLSECVDALLLSLFGTTKEEKMKKDNIREPFRENLSYEDHLDLTEGEFLARKNYIRFSVSNSVEAKNACTLAGMMVRLNNTFSDKVDIRSEEGGFLFDPSMTKPVKALLDDGTKKKKIRDYTLGQIVEDLKSLPHKVQDIIVKHWP